MKSTELDIIINKEYGLTCTILADFFFGQME